MNGESFLTPEGLTNGLMTRRFRVRHAVRVNVGRGHEAEQQAGDTESIFGPSIRALRRIAVVGGRCVASSLSNQIK